MNQAARLRILYWIGWLIWAVLAARLLLRLPESLPFVTWTQSWGVIHVTWSLIVTWFVLFWAWPLVLRPTGFKDGLLRAGRGVAPCGPCSGRACVVARSSSSRGACCCWRGRWRPTSCLREPSSNPWFRVGTTCSVRPFPTHGGEPTWLAVFLAIAYHSGVTLLRLLVGLVRGITLGVLTGLALPNWPAVVRTAWAPMNFLRMIPLLVAAP